jgi:hypothetical protein
VWCAVGRSAFGVLSVGQHVVCCRSVGRAAVGVLSVGPHWVAGRVGPWAVVRGDLPISQKPLAPLPADGCVSPKHVGATILN